MMQVRVRELLMTAPWLVGLVGAMFPVMWLWFHYPVTFNTRMVAGRVTNTAILQNEKMVPMGSQGVAYLTCHELVVSFEFEHNLTNQINTNSIESCDLYALKQHAEKLREGTVSVIYNRSRPDSAFLRELISKAKLKLATGLAMAAFVFGTLIAGQKFGRYSIDLNLTLSEIRFQYVLAGFALVLFYAWLILA